MVRIGMLYSRIREEEKLLLDEFRKRNLNVNLIYDGDCIFNLENEGNFSNLDVVLERSVSFSRALYALRFFEHYGIPTVNSFDVARICTDKILTSLALQENNVPTPRTEVAFTRESALKAIEKIGYPCVLKPVNGSWARLLAKINDHDSAEALLEHKETLGNYIHSIFYIQEYVQKPQRDIRASVVGNELICAVYRNSEHWITNTARGGKTTNCPVTPELEEICLRASNAIGNGVLAIDLMETKNGLVVHEINDRMEFRNSIAPTGVNIPEKIVDYVLSEVRR